MDFGGMPGLTPATLTESGQLVLASRRSGSHGYLVMLVVLVVGVGAFLYFRR